VNQVFVIVSFHSDMEPTFQAIKLAASRNGLNAQRVWDLPGDYRITDTIISMIRDSTMVVADLTHERPNVYFELGYARGLGKAVITIARKGTVLHFDVNDWNCIFYEDSRPLEAKLRARFRDELDLAHSRTVGNIQQKVEEGRLRWSGRPDDRWFSTEEFRNLVDGALSVVSQLPDDDRIFLLRGAVFHGHHLTELLPQYDDDAAVIVLIEWLGKRFRKPRYRAALLLQQMRLTVTAEQAIKSSLERAGYKEIEGLVEAIRLGSVRQFIQDISLSRDLVEEDSDDRKERKWLLDLADALVSIGWASSAH
jgi:hypothetical protein